jgi:peptide/nickel transport system permease protein
MSKHSTETQKINYGTSIWGEAFKRLLRNKAAIIGGIIFLLIVLVAIFADVIAPYGYEEQNLMDQYIPPFTSSEHIWGTDNMGRDIFSRVVYGARLSLSVGVVSVALALVVGTIIGIISGYCGGVVDNIIMRLMDILLAIPAILLAICISASLGTGLLNLMIAVGISTVPTYARIARASVMVTKGEDFIEAAKATGAGHFRLIVKYIAPNIVAPLVVQATLGVAVAILSTAALGFLGLGIQPPQSEWGTMLASTRNYMLTYPYLCIFPGLAIATTILSLNLLGDGLRDALDPKLKQ